MLRLLLAASVIVAALHRHHHLAVGAISIVSQERVPGCNPVPENSEATLKVVTDSTWDICSWYHSETDGDQGPLVCKQLMGSVDGDKLICATNSTVANSGAKSSTLTGGPAANKQSCELHISDIQPWDNGYWTVIVVAQTDATKEDSNVFQVIPNHRDVVSLNGPTSAIVGQRVSLLCTSADGLPRPYKFDWNVNENAEFYDSWSAILYPLQYLEASSNVSQTLSVIPPSAGTFTIVCESDQDGLYLPRSIANHTLTVADDSGDYFGKTKLKTGWVIVIIVSCSLLFILIVATIIAYCCGICCFRQKAAQKGQDLPDQGKTIIREPDKTPIAISTVQSQYQLQQQRATTNDDYLMRPRINQQQEFQRNYNRNNYYSEVRSHPPKTPSEDGVLV